MRLGQPVRSMHPLTGSQVQGCRMTTSYRAGPVTGSNALTNCSTVIARTALSVITGGTCRWGRASKGTGGGSAFADAPRHGKSVESRARMGSLHRDDFHIGRGSLYRAATGRHP